MLCCLVAHPSRYLCRGYRIRELTAAEKEVKVSQLVARQREWEDGLVGVYKRFLEVCESEITGTCSLVWDVFNRLSM